MDFGIWKYQTFQATGRLFSGVGEIKTGKEICHQCGKLAWPYKDHPVLCLNELTLVDGHLICSDQCLIDYAEKNLYKKGDQLKIF